MKSRSLFLLLVAALFLQVTLVAPAAGQGATRWGDFAGSALFGSFQLGFQKRLSQAGLEEAMCKPCAHYVEAWVDSGEADDGPIDPDADAFALGYRYYVVTGDKNPRKPERLAVFLRMGLSRVDLDPGQTLPGYYAGLGLEYPITQSVYPKDHPKAGKLRPFWISAVGAVTHNEIERPGANLDYTSARVGVRFVFPSKRDKRRAECLYGRRKEIDEKLTAELLGKLRGAGAGSPTPEGFGQLSLQDKVEQFPLEIEKLFRSGDLTRPEACREPGGYVTGETEL